MHGSNAFLAFLNTKARCALWAMGISGLLPLLKEIQHETHVEVYRGKTVGIDAYVWLHRGAYACATELALGRPTSRYIAYAMHRIRMLQHYGVRPYVVFDGAHLPSKAGTEAQRAARRREHRMRGLQLHTEKRSSAARDAFVRSIDITPVMAYELVKQLRAHAIPYIVAPYEADAQLAYLEKEGVIDAIITEDSDLLVYGCRTVLFKLDTYGSCVEIRRDHFQNIKQLDMRGWSHKEFRQMAILSGCDYLPSIAGMGLKNAHKFLRKYESIEQVIRALNLEGRWHVPASYAADFERAEFTFEHQRVYDPTQRFLTTLAPLPENVREDLVACIGASLTPEDACAIAHGDLCPITRRRFAQPMMATTAPSQPAQPTLRTFFNTPKTLKSSGRADSSSSTTTAASLFDATAASSPCTSPAHSADEACDGAASPASSHARGSDTDPCISSPVSSPPRPSSPPQPMHSTPAPSKLAKAASTTTPAPGLAWQTSTTPDDDMARRTAWFQRFKYSGTRPRHIVLPGTSPPTPGAHDTPSKRLPLGQKRACPASTLSRTSPTKRPAVFDTPSRVNTTLSGSAKLLQFQYRES